ncbi:MAG TPA: MFS transporter [Chloroflexota bacterium]
MALPSPSATADVLTAPRRPPGRFEAFSALGHRNFRFFWLGQLASVSAQSMEFVGLAWLVLDLTGSPFVLGLMNLMQAMPTLAFALVAGTAADRMDRRKLLASIFAIAALIYTAVGALVVTQLVQAWMVVVAAFLLGCLRVMDQPARHGMLPYTVPREDLANAVAMASLAFQVPRPVAPALAGLLIAFMGIGPTFFVVAVFALLATAMYRLLRVDAIPRGRDQHSWMQDVLEGVQFVRSDQLIYGLIGMTFVNSLFGLSYVVLLPVLAREVLHVGSEGYGFMQTASGVGGLFGALAAAQLARRGGKGRQALIGAVIFGALLISVSFSPWYLLVCALLFCAGVANQLYMTTTTTVLQLSIPNQLRGRVMSIWGLTFSLIPAGGALSGTVAQSFGAPLALALGGVLVIATTLVVAARFPRIRRLA